MGVAEAREGFGRRAPGKETAGRVALATGRRGLTYSGGEGAGGLEFTRATLERRRWSASQSRRGAGGGASMRCGLDCVSLGQFLGREWGGRGAAGSGRRWRGWPLGPRLPGAAPCLGALAGAAAPTRAPRPTVYPRARAQRPRTSRLGALGAARPGLSCLLLALLNLFSSSLLFGPVSLFHAFFVLAFSSLF